MTTVKFKTCSSKNTYDRETTMRRKADESDSELINRAVEKLWGKRHHWWSDSGLGLYYGQVVCGSNCVTSRVRVDVGE